jgi:NADH-quinone oxidoreductase subunit L
LEPDHVNGWIAAVPLLPLLAALTSAAWLVLARRDLPRPLVWMIHCTAPVLSFSVSGALIWELATRFDTAERYLTANFYTWISAGDFHAELALLFDPISAVLCLVVTGVGSLIHIYAAGYMRDDERPDRGYQRFFVFLNLLIGAMLVLLLADNLVLLLLGWQAVSLCSYLLIGFWYLDAPGTRAGQNAFVVNRIGDLGFLLGTCLLFWAFADAGHPTVSLREMSANAHVLVGQRVDVPWWLGLLGLDVPTWGLASLAGLLLFVAACARSAQLPLQVWLSDTSVAPTPVSALIQAAAAMLAGVYLLSRISFVLSSASGAQTAIAWIGGLTAVMAATVALAQRDIMRVLAWSTISQLGLSFLAVGVAAYTAALLHVVTHAFFKTLLLLGAGSVILALNQERRLERMGGLRVPMPWTHATFLVGAAVLAGLPLTSAFFSIDEILIGVFGGRLGGGNTLLGLALLSVALTAFYAARLYFLVFDGASRASYTLQHRVREQQAPIVFPLVILAALSVAGVWLFGLPDVWGEFFFDLERSNSLHWFLLPVIAETEAPRGGSGLITAAGLLATIIGLGVAFYLYRRQLPVSRWLRLGVVPVQRFLLEGWRIDALYDRWLVRPVAHISRGFIDRRVEARWIDRGLVRGIADGVQRLANGPLRRTQTGLVQSYVFALVVGGLVLLAWMVRGA